MRWLAVLALFAPTALSAQDACNPADHLARDYISFDENTETNIEIFDALAQSRASQSASKLAGSYSGYALDIADARKATSHMRKLLQTKFTDNQKRTLLISALSKTGLDAYRACLELNKLPVSFSVSEGAMARKEVLVTLNWHAKIPVPEQVGVGIMVTGGEVGEAIYGSKRYGDVLDVKMANNTSLTFKIKRESIFVPTEVKGDVFGQPFVIDIPASPKYRLVTQTREGNKTVYGPARETCTPANATVSCAEIPNTDEGFMLPGSFRWKAERTVVVNGRKLLFKATPGDDALKVCGEWELDCGEIKNYAHVELTGTGLQVKAVPVAEN